MSKKLLLLASVALSVAVASSVLLFSWVPGNMPRNVQTTTARPNIVFILADDMRKDDLRYMPKTRALLKDKGMSFDDAFVSNALCAPSRATIMRGQYAHNTGVWANMNGKGGGWEKFHQADEQDTMATRLHNAGYRTGLFGKYLNGYKNTTYVPPGWDRWFGMGSAQYYDYAVNDNGTIRHFGSRKRDYSTDVLRRRTRRFIGDSVNRNKPFFAYVATDAPHGPDIPAPRDRHTYDGLKAPRPPSFNEKDVSDKPPWIRKLPRLTSRQIAKIDMHHADRAETLQALDDLVGGVVGKLRSEGAMQNTYIFFTSDNGWEQGEHRIRSEKVQPYEESVRMPLLVRGPGVQAGSVTHKLALNTDYLPTFTDLAGASTPSYVDGRSLRPVLEGKATTWRSAVLLERGSNLNNDIGSAFYGVRTSGGKPRKYIKYATGNGELYDLGSDPYELRNGYKAAAPPSGLATRLKALKGCASAGCRSAENGR